MKPLRAAPASLHTSFHFHFNHVKFKTTFLQQHLTAVSSPRDVFLLSSVFESLCHLHGGWRRRTVWIWNMKVGFSLVDSCKLQTHRSGSVCDEAAVCQPLHPKAKQRLHFILSVCVARRSPDGGSASLFFHVGGKSFKSKTSRSVRSTNVWTGREPNLQPPISSCRVSQQFHEACGWNLTERSKLAPEKLVSLWAFTSLHQRTPGVIWKDRSLWHPVKEKKLLFFSKLQDEEHTVCLP